MRPYDLALRFVGEKEIRGADDHPMIQWGHLLVGLDPEEPDETPWCSSFLNLVCWLLRLPRSKRANARSWLRVGTPIPLERAVPGYDVVVFWRGDVNGWQGHVGLFAGLEGEHVYVLGGNQRNRVGIDKYPLKRLLGVRRLDHWLGGAAA